MISDRWKNDFNFSRSFWCKQTNNEQFVRTHYIILYPPYL